MKKGFSYLILLTYTGIILFPLYIIVMASFKSSADIFKDPLKFPGSLKWDNYVLAWVKGAIGQYFFNSVMVTVLAVLLLLLIGALASFSLSNKSFVLGKWIFAIILIGIMIPIQAYMVPLYVMVSNLGLLDSYTGLILTYVAIYISFSIFIITTFFKTIPGEILQAARIDGCNDMHLLFRIYVPLALPAFATVGIYCSVHIWNDVLLPLLFVRSKSIMTIPIGLISFKGEYLNNYSLLFAGVIISAIPMVIAYLMFQRMFIEGITAGSVKG